MDALYVHFHIVPRMADMPQDRREPNAMNYIGVAESEMVPLEYHNQMAEQIRGIVLLK